MNNKIDIQILSPARREQLIALRDEIRKIEGLEAFDLQVPARPLVQGKMDGGLSMIVLEAVISGVAHFTAEKTVEHYQGQLSALFNKILGKDKAALAHGVEAMSGSLPVEADKWKVAVADNRNGTKSVTCYDETGAVSVFSNRSYSIDPEHTYVVLIGVSEYDDSANFSRIPPVAGNLDEMYSIFTDKRLVGIPFENITRLYNENCIRIKDELRSVSRSKGIQTLIIYYSGHGQDTGNNQLSLVAKDTRNIDEELHNDIPYAFIEKMMNTSPADQKIIFIDACHSGLAAQGSNNVFDFEPVVGTFTLASTSAEESSYFKKEADNTYFTSFLAGAFKEGIAGSHTMLSLTDLHAYTSEKLLKSRLPAPVMKAQLKNILADNFYISHNPAFSLQARLEVPGQLARQGRYAEARREYILLEKAYPDNLQLRNEHLEFERNAEFNRLVKEGDLLFFRDKDFAAAQDKYREALPLKDEDSLRNKIAECAHRLQEKSSYHKEEISLQEKKKSGTTAIKKEIPRQEQERLQQPVLTAAEKKKQLVKRLWRLAVVAAAAVIIYFVVSHRSETTLVDNNGNTFTYKGELKDNRPDGQGRARYKNGNEYDGEWTNGMWDGLGTITWASSDSYTGYFKNNYLNGKGIIKYQNGEVYDGYWAYGNFQGKGVYKYKNGNVYDGDWLNNKQNGFGKFTWQNGDVYQGDFRNNNRDGTGTYTSASSDIFNCPGCRRYTGSWSNGLKQGFGSCFDVTGRLIYQGSFVNDVPVPPYPNR